MLDDRLDNIFLECWTPAYMVLLDHWERQGSMEHSEQGGDIVLHDDDTEYYQDNGVPAPDLLTPARTVSSCWLLLTVLSGDVISLTSPSLLWLLCNSVSNIIIINCINSYHNYVISSDLRKGTYSWQLGLVLNDWDDKMRYLFLRHPNINVVMSVQF